jgi:hypothetical protein
MMELGSCPLGGVSVARAYGGGGEAGETGSAVGRDDVDNCADSRDRIAEAIEDDFS